MPVPGEHPANDGERWKGADGLLGAGIAKWGRSRLTGTSWGLVERHKAPVAAKDAFSPELFREVEGGALSLPMFFSVNVL